MCTLFCTSNIYLSALIFKHVKKMGSGCFLYRICCDTERTRADHCSFPDLILIKGFRLTIMSPHKFQVFFEKPEK